MDLGRRLVQRGVGWSRSGCQQPSGAGPRFRGYLQISPPATAAMDPTGQELWKARSRWWSESNNLPVFIKEGSARLYQHQISRFKTTSKKIKHLTISTRSLLLAKIQNIIVYSKKLPCRNEVNERISSINSLKSAHLGSSAAVLQRIPQRRRSPP